MSVYQTGIPLLESPYSRKVIGFDVFGKFPVQENATDQAFVERFEGLAGEGSAVEPATPSFCMLKVHEMLSWQS